MMGSDNDHTETLTLIRVELGKLGEKIDQLKDIHKEIKNVDETAKEALNLARSVDSRLTKQENGQTWLWRTVASALITAIVGVAVMVSQFVIIK